MAHPNARTTLGQFLVGGVMAALVLACTADAVQTATTPNAAYVTYSLAAGAYTANYIPSTGTATLIMGTCTTLGERGVGQVSVLRIPSTDPSGGFIMWTGQNSPSITANSGKNSADYSPPAAVRIISLDYGDKVLLERGSTNDTVRVHNTTTGDRAGNMTWVW